MNSNEFYSNNTALGSFLLLVLLCMIVIIGSIFVIGAYFNFCDCNQKIEKSIDRISSKAEETKDPNEIRALKSLAERLKYICSETTQGNTIVFLFTIFSVALVSGSAYLLERSRKNVGDVEEKLRKVKNEVSNVDRIAQEIGGQVGVYLASLSVPLRLAVCLTKGRQTSWQIRHARKLGNVRSLVVDGRDLLTWILLDLQRIEEERIKIGDVECEAFLNETLDIKLNLEAVPNEFEHLVEDLIEICDNIIELLIQIGPKEQ